MRRKAAIVARILAVLSAASLVLAFALALLLPTMLPLGRLIAMVDQNFLVAMQDGVRQTLSDWTWRSIFLPLLARPCWLLPLALGMVFGGAALSINTRPGLSGSQRWRG